MKNRKGSYTVFAVIIFASVILLVFTVISASAQLAVSSTADHFGRLWGTSILAEYDLNLKDRYGLYGFRGEESLVEEKLNMYAQYSYEDKSYIDYEGADCRLDGYSLSDPAIVKEQMTDAVLTGNRPSAMYHNHNTEDTEKSRTITSRWILDNLPSAGTKGEVNVSSLADSIKNGAALSGLMGTAAVNRYIFTYFRCYSSGEHLGDTYFRNEIEYILSGVPDDERAEKNVKQKLILLRNVLNLAYLYSSPEKSEAALAFATALTPGPEAVLTQGILLEIWAYAEAQNDAAMLFDGKKVPLMKQSGSWALTLENAINLNESGMEQGYILPQNPEGASYEDYLRIFLNAVPETTRILRAMDLIQINMKYLYCDYFRLEDYYTGLTFTMTVNGVKHEFEETYERKKTEEPEGQLSD